MNFELEAGYVSRDLTHFVGRGKPEEEQYELLLKIVRSGWLTHPPHKPTPGSSLTVNPNVKLSDNEMYTPRMVCFCDIPVQNLGIHIRKYSRFGLAFPKDFIAQRGGMPVRYIPRSAKRGAARIGSSDNAENMGAYFDRMVRSYYQVFILADRLPQALGQSPDREEDSSLLTDLRFFFNFQVFSFLKFFDHTLPDTHPESYYLEREWRVLGNVSFSMGDIVRIIVPAAYKERLRSALSEYCGEIHSI